MRQLTTALASNPFGNVVGTDNAARRVWAVSPYRSDGGHPSVAVNTSSAN